MCVYVCTCVFVCKINIVGLELKLFSIVRAVEAQSPRLLSISNYERQLWKSKGIFLPSSLRQLRFFVFREKTELYTHKMVNYRCEPDKGHLPPQRVFTYCASKEEKKKTQRKFDFLIFWQSHELKFEFGIRTKQTVAVRGFENWCKNMWVNGKDKHIDTCRHIKIRRHKRITQKLYLSQREQKLNWFSVLAR